MEEWNEYGELKDKVGTGAAAPPISTPSAPSTPSKVPQPTDTPSKASLSTAIPLRPQQSSTDSPLTTAMRQAGFEAAKKAGEAKSQTRAKGFGESKTSNDALKKLDNSTATGLLPPTGTTEASPAKAPETRSSTAESKADTVPATSGTRGKDTFQLRTSKAGGSDASVKTDKNVRSQEVEDDEDGDPLHQKPGTIQSTSQPEISDVEDESTDHPSTKKVSQPGLNPGPGEVDIVKVLKEQGKTGGPLLDLSKLNKGKTAATTATTTEDVHRAQPSSDKRTQEQAAGERGHAGESVGD